MPKLRPGKPRLFSKRHLGLEISSSFGRMLMELHIALGLFSAFRLGMQLAVRLVFGGVAIV